MITLIASGHRENGLCNSNELVKILEGINPKVIFEEIPPNKFEHVYSGKLRDSLESEAVKIYKQNHSVLNFPVDLNTTQERENYLRLMFNSIQNFFNDYSAEHKQIYKEHKISVEISGFSYLNSKKCEELLNRKLLLENEIVNSIQDIELSKDYNDWLSFIEKRRNTIISNIYSLRRAHNWDNAILLIGAEHRKALIEKIEIFEKENDYKLNWNFSARF